MSEEEIFWNHKYHFITKADCLTLIHDVHQIKLKKNYISTQKEKKWQKNCFFFINYLSKMNIEIFLV